MWQQLTEAQVGVSVTVQGQTRLAHALSLELFDSLQIGIRSDGRPSKKTAAKITFFPSEQKKVRKAYKSEQDWVHWRAFGHLFGLGRWAN